MAVEVFGGMSAEGNASATAGMSGAEDPTETEVDTPGACAAAGEGGAAKSDEEEGSEEEEEGEVYEVEKILQERSRKGVKEYLVRWKGYDENWDTWEPEDNLNCDDIIEEFKRSKKPRGTPGRKRKTGAEEPTPKRATKSDTKSEASPRQAKPPAAKGKPGRQRRRKESSDEENASESATIVRCKTRFKKFVIEHAIEAEDERDSDDERSDDPLKKYFLRYDLDSGEFTVGNVTVQVDEEAKLFVCGSCQKSGPPWGRKANETSASFAKHLATSIKCHVIGQHLGGWTCHLCEKNQLNFHSRTLRAYQMHMNEVHRRKMTVATFDEEEEGGTAHIAENSQVVPEQRLTQEGNDGVFEKDN